MIRSDGKFVRDYFYVEDGAARYMLLAEQLAGAAGAARRGVQFLQRDAGHGAANWSSRILAHDGLATSSRTIRNEASHEIRHQYLERRQGAERARLAAAVHAWTKGSSATIAWYREFLADEPKCDALRRTRGRQILDLVAAVSRRRLSRAASSCPDRRPCPCRAASSTRAKSQHLVDASLDFWLTTGRFAARFEQEFARLVGVRHAMLVNSGSSANLLAVSC